MRADPDGEWLDERILEILRDTGADTETTRDPDER